MKRYLFIGLVLLLHLSLLNTPAFSAPKEGSKCTILGQTKNSKGQKFTCLKSGKNLVWSKGIPTKQKNDSPSNLPNKSRAIDVKQIYSTDDGYYDNISGPFAYDPNFPKEWIEVQQSFIKNQGTTGPFGQVRLAKYKLGLARPTATFEPSKNYDKTDLCKISSSQNRNALSFYNANLSQKKHPGPNSIIQLIPIYAQDTAKPVNSPSQDYLKYLSLIKEWIDYSSDFGSNAEVRIPDRYIEFPNKIEQYKLTHPVSWNTPGHVRFNQDVISTVDPVIDFTGANIGIVVAPAGTDATIMQQAALGSFNTSEGYVASASSQFATLATNMNKSEFAVLGQPFWWIHELFHVGYGLDDHYGDGKNNVNGEYGMGWWTLMTPFGGDLSVWEKWQMGFIQDSQIQCVVNPQSSFHWIAPASVQTQESKAIIIPISPTKVVVVESIRPAGLHYKIPQSLQGVLVYEIDLTKSDHGMGMKLSLPTNRAVSSNPFAFGFFLGDAPLRKGDRTTSNGLQIQVVETGNFGDVVKVEKVS
jgi:M6 family metalloprotease-like protein